MPDTDEKRVSVAVDRLILAKIEWRAQTTRGWYQRYRPAAFAFYARNLCELLT